MASKTSSLALFLILNLLFFTLIASASRGPSGAVNSKGLELGHKPKVVVTGNCPRNTQELKGCMDLLNFNNRSVSAESCCSVTEELADVDAAACFCTAIQAKLDLGAKLGLFIPLKFLLKQCGNRHVPLGFRCG